MYIGHGSTLKNIPNQEIEKINMRALPLLFGCGSGKLERMGRLMDPIGKLSNFFFDKTWFGRFPQKALKIGLFLQVSHFVFEYTYAIYRIYGNINVI